jgi:hypothetical protein
MASSLLSLFPPLPSLLFLFQPPLCFALSTSIQLIFNMFYRLPSLRYRASLNMPSFTTMVQEYMPIHHLMNDEQRFSHVIRLSLDYFEGNEEEEHSLHTPDTSSTSTWTSSSIDTSTNTSNDEDLNKEEPDVWELQSILTALRIAIWGRQCVLTTPSARDVVPFGVHSRLTSIVIDLARHSQNQRKPAARTSAH